MNIEFIYDSILSRIHSKVRADAASGAHFGGKVIGVVPVNGQVQVISDPDYSTTIAGRYFSLGKGAAAVINLYSLRRTS